jgi:Ser/Thr protein kinase RdoA (MazF antagonist)
MGMNDVYLLRTENETYFLRISPTGVYKLNDYKEETAIIDLLSQHNIGVANPIKCRDGSSVWSVNAPEGERFAILFPEAKNQPSQDQLKNMYNLGVAIARMHMITDENNVQVSRPPIDLVQLVDTLKKLIKQHFGNRMGDYEYLCDSMDKISQFINYTLPMTKPYYGFCHGDLNTMNIYFDSDLPVMFDFDTMGYGWRAHDLAVFYAILHSETKNTWISRSGNRFSMVTTLLENLRITSWEQYPLSVHCV